MYSWLANDNTNFELDFYAEVTINPKQCKSFDLYHNMMNKAFTEIYRVIKPGKYVTIAFHNSKIRIYNSIHKAAVLASFYLEKVVYQPPARSSAKQLLQPYGSAKGDYYLRLKKPEKRRRKLADEREMIRGTKK